MNRRLTTFAAALLMIPAGCFHAIADSGQEPHVDSHEVRIRYHPSYLLGSYTPDRVDLGALGCETKPTIVYARRSLLHVLASVVTAGIYTPLEVGAVCAPGASQP